MFSSDNACIYLTDGIWCLCCICGLSVGNHHFYIFTLNSHHNNKVKNETNSNYDITQLTAAIETRHENEKTHRTTLTKFASPSFHTQSSSPDWSHISNRQRVAKVTHTNQSSLTTLYKHSQKPQRTTAINIMSARSVDASLHQRTPR